jgi:hypothetical protein
MSVDTCMKELIDNSIDAGASSIRVFELGGDLTVEDNGCGFADLSTALVFGKSTKKGDRKVGRYGVGMKKACVKFSNATKIQSRGKEIYVDWEGIIENGASNEVPIHDSGDGPTAIVLEDFEVRRGSRKPIDSLHLSKVYGLLIENGSAMISVNGKDLDPLPLPQIEQILEKEVEWRGRKARIKGGVYPTNDPQRSTWSGYYPYYNGRLITDTGGGIHSAGLGELTIQNFCFLVDLVDGEKPWQLSTHKDGVEDLDDFLEHLYDEVTRSILEEAEKKQRNNEDKEIEKQLNRWVSENPKVVNGIRSVDQNNSGSVTPKGTPRKRRRSEEWDSDGDYQPASPSVTDKGYRVFFEDIDGLTLGCCSVHAKFVAIKFNTNHPWVQENRKKPEVIGPVASSIKTAEKVQQKQSQGFSLPMFYDELMGYLGEEFAKQYSL